MSRRAGSIVKEARGGSVGAAEGFLMNVHGGIDNEDIQTEGSQIMDLP